MELIAVNLTLVAYIVLPLGAITLGVTVYFFLKTRASLQQTMEANRQSSFVVAIKQNDTREKKQNLISDLENQFSKMKQKLASPKEETPAPNKKIQPKEETPPPAKKPMADENIVHELKATIAQQQRLLTSYLQQVEEIENEGKEELRMQNQHLEKEIAKLHQVIEQKDQEIEEVQLQAEAAHKMASKIEDVYQEFEQLQEKLASVEKQARSANELAMEMDDTRHSYEQVHKELVRKHERLEEVMAENHRMHQELNVLEDKLSEANNQRQQLQKKIQFLQDLNADMQSISDANKKLQTELRRIGELESMLHLMAEERDSLLRKKSEK